MPSVNLAIRRTHGCGLKEDENMTFGEWMIDTGMIKDDDMVTVVEVANGNVVRSARGRWMFDHILEFTQNDLIGFEWDKKKGWKITVASMELTFC